MVQWNLVEAILARLVRARALLWRRTKTLVSVCRGIPGW